MEERYLIIAHRSGASVLGAASLPLKQGDEYVPPLAKLYAQAICDDLNVRYKNSPNVHYTLERVEP